MRGRISSPASGDSVKGFCTAPSRSCLHSSQQGCSAYPAPLRLNLPQTKTEVLVLDLDQGAARRLMETVWRAVAAGSRTRGVTRGSGAAWEPPGPCPGHIRRPDQANGTGDALCPSAGYTGDGRTRTVLRGLRVGSLARLDLAAAVRVSGASREPRSWSQRRLGRTTPDGIDKRQQVGLLEGLPKDLINANLCGARVNGTRG
jgi:hypothetical protein